jgi:putative RecB family exonuclease
MAFKDRYVSYTRLDRYARCPRQYAEFYEGTRNPLIALMQPQLPLVNGIALHAVKQDLVNEVRDELAIRPLDYERAKELWKERAMAEPGIIGPAEFREGLEILRAFCASEGIVDYRNVLGVEQEFRIRIGSYSVLGYIDRVDKIDDETIEIRDYKSNRVLFTREEVDESLQLSIYALAAKELWPWAKNIRLCFHMVRQNLKLYTERTDEQLESVRAYIEAVATSMSTATKFPARLNPNCVFCEVKNGCPEYERALKAERKIIADDPADIEKVALEREDVFSMVKTLSARKDELEAILKTCLKGQPEIVVNGVRYAMFNTTRVEHPRDKTIDLVAKATGMSPDEVAKSVTVIDKDALESLLKEKSEDMGKPRLNLLRAELDAHAEKSHSPRFWAKALPGKKVA